MNTNSKLILQFVGDPASGKSTGANYMVERYGFEAIRPSTILREYAAKIGMELVKREDFLVIHRMLDIERGLNFVSDFVLQHNSSKIVVDGVRLRSQVALLKPFGKVVAFECPADIRYERAVLRGDGKDNRSFELFLADEAAEYDSPLPPYPSTHGVMAMADVLVDSSLPYEAVTAQLDDIANTMSF